MPTTSQVVGYLSEVEDGVWMGILSDHAADGSPTARRLFRVAESDGTTATEDVSALVSTDDPYPGVVRYR